MHHVTGLPSGPGSPLRVGRGSFVSTSSPTPGTGSALREVLCSFLIFDRVSPGGSWSLPIMRIQDKPTCFPLHSFYRQNARSISGAPSSVSGPELDAGEYRDKPNTVLQSSGRRHCLCHPHSRQAMIHHPSPLRVSPPPRPPPPPHHLPLIFPPPPHLTSQESGSYCIMNHAVVKCQRL